MPTRMSCCRHGLPVRTNFTIHGSAALPSLVSPHTKCSASCLSPGRSNGDREGRACGGAGRSLRRSATATPCAPSAASFTACKLRTTLWSRLGLASPDSRWSRDAGHALLPCLLAAAARLSLFVGYSTIEVLHQLAVASRSTHPNQRGVADQHAAKTPESAARTVPC